MLDEASPYYRQVSLLLELLPQVAREDCFALKGGTAINFFVRDMPRLSVDIDLAFLPVLGREESLGAIDAALERVARAIEAQVRGSKVLRTRAEGRTIKLTASRAGVPVKIEVSPVLRGCVREPAVLGVSPAVENQFGYAEARVLHRDDLYAGKLCAAADRQHPRDLFDVRELLAADEWDEGLSEVFVVYLLSGDRPLAEMLAPNRLPLAGTYEAQFAGMAMMPVSREELEAVRETMLARLLGDLTERQRRFLLGFKAGEPDWSLLDLPQVETLPAVQWKLLNIRRMAADRRAAALARLERVLYG